MNIDNINKTIDLMRTTKDFTFYMGLYVDEIFDEDENICGTSCCLAGFARVADVGYLGRTPNDPNIYMTDYKFEATRFFDITDEQAERLFTPRTEGIEVRDLEEGIRALEQFRDHGTILWEDPKYDIERTIYPRVGR